VVWKHSRFQKGILVSDGKKKIIIIIIIIIFGIIYKYTKDVIVLFTYFPVLQYAVAGLQVRISIQI